MLKTRILLLIASCILSMSVSNAMAQNQPDRIRNDYYQFGADERLLITVHILGEVRNPGEYLVPDNTNLLELISKAGGPTEFSDLSEIKITRGLLSMNSENTLLPSQAGRSSNTKKRVIKINLKKTLSDEDYSKHLPILLPGDVVKINKNTWHTWQSVIRVVSQVAIVIQAMYWYSRIEN